MNLPSAASGAVRVLLVEDDRVQQLLVSTLLEREGCLVDLAEDGHEALALWQEHRHTLVVTDCRMPRMDGYAFTQALRALPGGDSVTVVGMSADTDDRVRARQAGMNALLDKPLTASAVAQLLRRG
ncbi:MAG: response regulator [Caldimonas sp.]|uniref:response regulator n=1 Tax=Caldimonas sp. TaxID=2838790 RepID=UPI00391CFD2D